MNCSEHRFWEQTWVKLMSAAQKLLNSVNSLSLLSFFICNMGITALIIWRGHNEDQGDNTWEASKYCPSHFQYSINVYYYSSYDYYEMAPLLTRERYSDPWQMAPSCFQVPFCTPGWLTESKKKSSSRLTLSTWVAIYLKQPVWLELFPFAVFMSPEACTAMSTFQKFEK